MAGPFWSDMVARGPLRGAADIIDAALRNLNCLSAAVRARYERKRRR